jgi:hypothetical protein
MTSNSPTDYHRALEHVLESWSVTERGDDPRGRNLQALYFLEFALEHGWFSYLPSRQPGRWVMNLLDLLGSLAGKSASQRLGLDIRGLVSLLSHHRLTHIAELTCATLTRSLEMCPEFRDLSRPLMRRVLETLDMVSLLQWLGFKPDAVLSARDRAGSVYGQKIRQQLSNQLDPHWETVIASLEQESIPDFLRVLVSLPPSFQQLETMIEHQLQLEDSSLKEIPFAVFYARVTDAPGDEWSGRHYISEDDRSAFEAWVGRHRERRLSGVTGFETNHIKQFRLGVRAACPLTIQVIDRWLEQKPIPEFCWESDWFAKYSHQRLWLETLERTVIGRVTSSIRHQTKMRTETQVNA